VNLNQQSYAELHNAAVAAAQEGRMPQAEALFSEAIRRQPEAAISWVARGISRSEQGNIALAAQDFNHAAALYRQMGDQRQADQLIAASRSLNAPPARAAKGNGLGSQLLSGAAAALQVLGPLAVKALLPMGL
jgi:tetratricopeptide (TPR) repeat protein